MSFGRCVIGGRAGEATYMPLAHGAGDGLALEDEKPPQIDGLLDMLCWPTVGQKILKRQSARKFSPLWAGINL